MDTIMNGRALREACTNRAKENKQALAEEAVKIVREVCGPAILAQVEKGWNIAFVDIAATPVFEAVLSQLKSMDISTEYTCLTNGYSLKMSW